MNDEHDPLAPFRREPRPAAREPEQKQAAEQPEREEIATPNSKHTPGPWTLQITDTHINIVGNNGESVLTGDLALNRANIDLIAAAPEMYNALHEYERIIAEYADQPDNIQSLAFD